MKRLLLSLTLTLLGSIACHGQNLIVAATNLPGPGYAAWTNLVAKYNQATSTNKNVNVTGFNYWKTNVVAAVTDDAGQVVKPAVTNVVEIHPRMTSAQLLVEFSTNQHFIRLTGEALQLYIRDKRAEINDQIEFNWWNGVK